MDHETLEAFERLFRDLEFAPLPVVTPESAGWKGPTEVLSWTPTAGGYRVRLKKPVPHPPGYHYMVDHRVCDGQLRDDQTVIVNATWETYDAMRRREAKGCSKGHEWKPIDTVPFTYQCFVCGEIDTEARGPRRNLDARVPVPRP